MTLSRRVWISVMVVGIALAGLGLGERLPIPVIESVISSAEAVVGRPLTPVSVAGAARRTVRRCAAGVYNC